MPQIKENKTLTVLPPKTANESETAWTDTWKATEEARTTARPYSREKFQSELNRIGRRITDEISSQPDEVQRLRAGIKEADEGKMRPLRRTRGSKSG